MKPVSVLVACEKSGIVREAFNAYSGVEAFSCDLEPCEDGRSDYHIQQDVRNVITSRNWNALIAFPPCTHLAVSGALYFKAKRADGRQQEALNLVSDLLNCHIANIALENPVGIISTQICKPTQIIQPWMFGENASKKTCLWLKNFPKLLPTKVIGPRIVNGRPRWANQTDSGQNRLAPSPTHATDRSRTYPGIASAMAAQWVEFLVNNA